MPLFDLYKINLKNDCYNFIELKVNLFTIIVY